jgi:hypothetical protein
MYVRYLNYLLVLAVLHSIPSLLRVKTAMAPNPPLHRPSDVKYHPRPEASSSCYNNGTPTASIAQRAILAAAAAVLGLCRKTSTEEYCK